MSSCWAWSSLLWGTAVIGSTRPSDDQHRQVPGSYKAEVAPPERCLGSLTWVLLGAPAALREKPSFSGRPAPSPALLLTHRALHPHAQGPHPSRFPCTALLADSSRQPSLMPPALARSCLSLESRSRPSSLGPRMGSRSLFRTAEGVKGSLGWTQEPVVGSELEPPARLSRAPGCLGEGAASAPHGHLAARPGRLGQGCCTCQRQRPWVPSARRSGRTGSG